MLLERSRSALTYSGPFQNMGTGRQTIDHVWTIVRLVALEQEWRYGIWLLKLDIAKAFDSLNRGRFLQRLREKMGCCGELRSWWQMFEHTEAGLATSWGESAVPMSSGIRQGSIESPQFFSTAMDWIVKDVAEGLGFAESAFVDGCILWNGTKSRLSTRAQQLIDEIALWGLQVNADKSQVYHRPFPKESGALQVGEHMVVPDDRLDVMGVPFKVGISPKHALQPILAWTTGKFWAMKHLVRARTPLKGRLQLIQKVMSATALWCAGAIHPDKQALQSINLLQSQLVV